MLSLGVLDLQLHTVSDSPRYPPVTPRYFRNRIACNSCLNVKVGCFNERGVQLGGGGGGGLTSTPAGSVMTGVLVDTVVNEMSLSADDDNDDDEDDEDDDCC